MFRVFTDKVEIPVAGEEKSVEEIQAVYFADVEIRKIVLGLGHPLSSHNK